MVTHISLSQENPDDLERVGIILGQIFEETLEKAELDSLKLTSICQ